MRGTVVAAHERYDEARAVWNALIDRRPALIAYCAGTADVVHALNFARSQELVVAVRSGGHSFPGHSVCDDGIVIDLSHMKGTRVDVANRTVRAEAGLTWGELDHETQAFGLATTGGMVSLTGIAGLTVGGGSQGWLVRKHGATCDNLLSADVVTADGRVVTASPIENGSCSGVSAAGAGTSASLPPSSSNSTRSGPSCLVGRSSIPLLTRRRSFAFTATSPPDEPDELTTMLAFLTAPELPFLPEAIHNAPMVAIISCYAGDLDAGEAIVRPLREFGPPAADVLGPMQYSALQTLFNATSGPGWMRYTKSDYFDELSDEAIDTITTIGRHFVAAHRYPPQPLPGRVGCVRGRRNPD